MQQMDFGIDAEPEERLDVLPCHHEEKITAQVQPTIDLLSDLDQLHPDILLSHQIQPLDYRDSLVFRSAVESIRGTFISSSTTGRERLVESVLMDLKRLKRIEEYKHTSNEARYDFEVKVKEGYYGYIEVKGGEGNSINISDRPLSANEFGIWSHLDGAIVNQPAAGARSIINRISNELVRRKKQVDFIVYKDIICGTRIRPCPKYKGMEATIGLAAAPDIFLLPKNIPTLDTPIPDVFTIDELLLPRYILDLYNVKPEETPNHIWSVQVSLHKEGTNRLRRWINVTHNGKVVAEWKSKGWRDQ